MLDRLHIGFEVADRLKLFAIAVALLGGCATVSRGATEVFQVETNPARAEVTSSTGWTCTTPCAVKIARRGELVLTIEKDGYNTVIKHVPSTKDSVQGDIRYGGIIGSVAGAATAYSHKPNPLKVRLVEDITQRD